MFSRLSATWLLNGKGISQEALGQRNLLTRDVKDPKLAGVAKELIKTREQLADLAMTVPNPDTATRRQRSIADLAATERRLGRELGTAASSVTQNSWQWLELDEIRETLGAEAALIDIARFDVYDFSGEQYNLDRLPARYVAWITRGPGIGETVVVDLGLAAEIDSLVERVRRGIHDATPEDFARFGHETTTNLLKKDLAALSQRIWQPLEPHVADVQTVVLSPDGALWLAPWCALPIGKNQDEYLIDRYGLHYVTSGRDLIVKSEDRKTRAPVILANPLFDQQAAGKRDAMRAMFKSLPAADGADTRIFSAKSLLPQVSPLPKTGIEAIAIQPNMEKYTGRKAILYEKGYALERVAKVLKSPVVVSFATHGFFLPTQESKRADHHRLGLSDTRAVALDKDSKPIENPLLRCGLLLAGCNNRDATVGDDDGILTGLEIVGIDFRGTELVVLSACETGVGDVKNGEGVAGLRQAFQLAGAQSVVSSLWNVADGETARLMQLFFENLANGMNKSEALRQAQLTRIKARRERYGATHPFFWAAFTLTGQE